MTSRHPGGSRSPAPARDPLTGAVVLAVAVGGVAGTLARWLLVEVLPSPASSPAPGWIMLSGVNLLGSFLLGLLTALTSRRPLPRWLSGGLGVGVLGSFTSLSAVVLASALATGLMTDPGPGPAPGGPAALAFTATGVVLALALSAALGTAAALAGLRAGRWGDTRARPAPGGTEDGGTR